VNATPLGTLGIREHETVATVSQFRGVRLAYDLVYNPLETQFLREARAAGVKRWRNRNASGSGCRTILKFGLGMLLMWALCALRPSERWSKVQSSSLSFRLR